MLRSPAGTQTSELKHSVATVAPGRASGGVRDKLRLKHAYISQIYSSGHLAGMNSSNQAEPCGTHQQNS